MAERAPRCKHPHLHYTRRCKSCGEMVDIREKRNKYGNRRTNGFASAKEARRYEILKVQKRAGLINDLECQVPFELEVNGEHITQYIADFRYVRLITQGCGNSVVEDAKPKGKRFKKTDAYRLFMIKKRLMKACHGIDVVEV